MVSSLIAHHVVDSGASHKVVSAIQNASQRTGVDFDYLVQQAKVESAFDPNAKAKTSSATGLYQFIEKTWLSMVRDHGHKIGLNDLAQTIDAQGRVDDPQTRAAILNLRRDPDIAAYLAAELAAENKAYLSANTHLNASHGTTKGDQDGIGATELYMAHFLGAAGAAAFLNAKEENPLALAADRFPQAARANANIFYDPKTGNPRTLGAIYEHFAAKLGAQSGDPIQSTNVAHSGAVSSSYSPLVTARQAVPHFTTQAHYQTPRNMHQPADHAFGWLSSAIKAPVDVSMLANLPPPDKASL